MPTIEYNARAPENTADLRLDRLALGLLLLAIHSLMPLILGPLEFLLPGPRYPGDPPFYIVTQSILFVPTLLTALGILVLTTVRPKPARWPQRACVAAALLSLALSAVFAVHTVWILTHPAPPQSAFEMLQQYIAMGNQMDPWLPLYALDHLLNLALLGAFLVFMLHVARQLRRPNLTIATSVVVGISLAFESLSLLRNAGEFLTAVGFGPGQRVAMWVSSLSSHYIIRTILVEGSAALYLIAVALLANRLKRRSDAVKEKAAPA